MIGTSKKWKGRERPHLDHVTSLFSDNTLSAFVTGHLIIESLLVQMIDLKLEHPDKFNAFNLNFPTKVNICEAVGLIDLDMASFLLEMNKIRNRFAHKLGYSLSFDDAYCFAQIAAGVTEFSDTSIYSDKENSKEWYGVEGIIQEVFQNVAQDLAFIIDEDGGGFLSA